MKLLENINCEKGITLNSQLVDLLSILDKSELSEEEKNIEIEKYIAELEDIQERFNEACKSNNKYQFMVNDVISGIEGLESEQIEKLKNIYVSSISDLSTCNKEKMEKILKENGFDTGIHEQIMIDLKSKDYTAKEGILLLTPEKVRALYNHLFKDGNTYDRVTFDEVGKYSGYVCVDGETLATEKIEKMQKFCEAHGMKTKINTLMFYADFPKVYEQSLEKRVQNGEITEEDKKQLIQKSLFAYVRNVGQKYGSRVESVDIMNELIYDPNMKEEGFDEPTNDFQYRTQGWHKYLGLEDICKMALIARKEMPDVKFTYNDVNWTEPKKRQEIIKLLKQIQQYEEKFRTEGIEIDGEIVKLGENEKIIDTIGFEAHIDTDVDFNEMENAVNDVITEVGLPIEITELDVGCFGQDVEKEKIKQGKVFAKIMEIVQKYPEDIKSLTIWSQSDECSFLNKKNPEKEWKIRYASLLDSNFEEKEFELDLIKSGVQATEEKVRTSMINKQIEIIKEEKNNQLNNENEHKLEDTDFPEGH